MRWRHVRSSFYIAALAGGFALLGTVASAPRSLAASSTIKSQICNAGFVAPAIVEPLTGYRSTASNVTVKGTGEPGMTVSVLVGGQPKAATVVAVDGVFSVQVPLAIGNNILVAREKDECDNVKDSPEVTVTREQEPAPAPGPGPTKKPGSSPASRRGAAGFGSFPNVSGGAIDSGEKPSQQEEGVDAPKITSLKEGQVVRIGRVWVAGTGQPGSVVIIYVNGKEVARVIVGEDGTFGAEVALKPGENTIKAVEERDGKRIATRTWHVTYVQEVAREVADVRWILWTFVLMTALLAVLLGWLGYRFHTHRQKEGEV